MVMQMNSKLFHEEWSDKLAIGTVKDFSYMQDALLLIIAERLEAIGEMSPKEAENLAYSASITAIINQDISYINRAIRKQNRKYLPRISQLIKSVESENFKQAKVYFDYRKISIEKIRKSKIIDNLISAIKKQIVDELLNTSHTFAYSYNGKTEPIGKVYRKIVNKAVVDMSIGEKSFQRTMKNAIKQLSESGIKTLVWEHSEDGKKAVYRRADSHIRMNIKEGISRINTELQTELGKSFGADGVETTMHSLCAPDHQPYQGRQFTKEQWENINKHLKRPWGTLNCHHFASPIILGVSVPAHSEAESRDAARRSNEVITYNGKSMTRYEASQKMRVQERSIRILRSEKKAFEKAGDLESASKINKNIKLKITKYKEFCSAVGLKPQLDRTYFYI